MPGFENESLYHFEIKVLQLLAGFQLLPQMPVLSPLSTGITTQVTYFIDPKGNLTDRDLLLRIVFTKVSTNRVPEHIDIIEICKEGREEIFIYKSIR